MTEATWLPEPDEHNQPFFEGARAGELRMQCCSDCSGWMYPVKQRCQHCGSTNLAWRVVSGRGTVYSHARLHRVYHPRHEGRLPLILGGGRAYAEQPGGLRSRGRQGRHGSAGDVRGVS
jgi:uncharacterized OB-fold protein